MEKQWNWRTPIFTCADMLEKTAIFNLKFTGNLSTLKSLFYASKYTFFHDSII